MAKKEKLPYQEGDWFAVPLLTSGYVVGIVTRMNGRGQVLGYFFSPKLEKIPCVEELDTLYFLKANFIHIFGDVSLLDGSWPVIWRMPDWNKDDWPVPSFATRDDKALPNKAWIVSRADDLRVLGRRLVTKEEAMGLPDNGIYGTEALRVHLTMQLDESAYRKQKGL